MIRIVKAPDEVKEVRCQYCGCLLEYDSHDVDQIVETKEPCILCPNCGNVILLEEEVFKPDVWPDDYYEYGGANSKHLNDTDVRNYIKECAERTKESKEITYVACGDTFVLSLPDCDDDGELETISVIVAQGYKEGLVYERED